MNWIISFNRIWKLGLFGVTLIFLVASCSGDDHQDRTSKTVYSKDLQKSLLDANRKAVQTEDQQIDDFIKRYNWNMSQTGTGLRYNIYQNGKGKRAVEGKIAVINYEVSLLNGKVLYTSAVSGPKEFMIGRGGVESGLEEGILLMREGDHAKFIIPSHLAYGLAGDQNKITGKATLVYDVELLKLK